MYPIERRLYTLKRYVRNRARPEGSIAEAYIADECLTFCSRYMDDVDTRFNRELRNMGFSNEEAYGVDVLGMELILFLHLNLYMMKMALIKWCGLCSTIVVKWKLMWSMF